MRDGDQMASVVDCTPYMTVYLVSVILTERNRVVVTVTAGGVVTQYIIAPVLIV